MAEGSERRDGRDLVLPAFEMDCREWLVVGPTEAGLPEDVAGAPLLAVLSTVVIAEDLEEATGALTVGMLDDDEDLDIREVAPGAAAYELVEEVLTPGTRRYVIPAPGRQSRPRGPTRAPPAAPSCPPPASSAWRCGPSSSWARDATSWTSASS